MTKHVGDILGCALRAIAVVWPLLGAGCDECKTSRDCFTGQVCMDGACVGGGTFDADTDADTDADADADADADGDLDWITIPGGTFEMGSTDPETIEARPIHSVTVAGFEMTRSEITVLQYVGCVVDGVCVEPADDARQNWGINGRQHFPMNYVTWEDAAAFCAWAGGRLPSEAEWEYAARNLGQDINYPWGDEEPSCQFAVIFEGDMGCGTGQSTAVCSIPAGNTQQGLCDMIGNVWEWTADHWHETYESAPDDGSPWIDDPEVTESRALRGGGYQQESIDERLRAADRYPFEAITPMPDLGFRCARNES